MAGGKNRTARTVIRRASIAAGLGQREANRNLAPALHRDTVAPCRDESPSRAHRFNRGLIKRIEPGRLRDLDSLDGTVRSHLDAQQHGALLRPSARLYRINRNWILAIFDMCRR